ncbi:hypothetical protein CEXT_298321 [Caerostris extrusa]|uniref:Uncharacterized protein n=1 Tax=Caerostris extrusa TaxID=172846 RepID=A0AAV4WKN4_CAEEX|nr:hypothetical protein CEXT_298321 [Caerostris extrusa]
MLLSSGIVRVNIISHQTLLTRLAGFCFCFQKLTQIYVSNILDFISQDFFKINSMRKQISQLHKDDPESSEIPHHHKAVYKLAVLCGRRCFWLSPLKILQYFMTHLSAQTFLTGTG